MLCLIVFYLLTPVVLSLIINIKKHKNKYWGVILLLFITLTFPFVFLEIDAWLNPPDPSNYRCGLSTLAPFMLLLFLIPINQIIFWASNSMFKNK